MQLEFFLDRNLGRRVAEGLKVCGWTVHRIGDVFSDDVQDIADEDWISPSRTAGLGDTALSAVS